MPRVVHCIDDFLSELRVAVMIAKDLMCVGDLSLERCMGARDQDVGGGPMTKCGAALQ
jgi:hypothetical protein